MVSAAPINWFCAVGRKRKTDRNRSENHEMRIAFIRVPKPMRPLKMMSISTTRPLINSVTVPKLREVWPEIPRASVFHALVPAEPACMPNTLPIAKQASPRAHIKKRFKYSFIICPVSLNIPEQCRCGFHLL